MANRQIKNILVGVGKLEVAPTSGTSYNPAGLVDVGFTIDGVEITLEPNMVDIEVDQLGDAAKIIHQSTKVMIKTTLAEATLQNLAIAWGYPDTSVTGDGVTVDQVLNLGVFQTGLALERSLRFTGTNPNGFPRVYVCRRVISVATSGHSFKRGQATVFPVEFRVLPDASQTGSEYGVITDYFSASA